MANRHKFRFFDGTSDEAVEYYWRGNSNSSIAEMQIGGIEKVKQSIGRALNSRNVAFLFGAGCSSFIDRNDKEVGIPTMVPLAKNFVDSWGNGEILSKFEKHLMSEFGFSKGTEEVFSNLENLMELLYSLRFTLNHSLTINVEDERKVVNKAIDGVKKFLYTTCSNSKLYDKQNTVRESYEIFYRKLMLRDQSLPTPWVFTTNYDMFNEKAMDHLGVPYGNGFSGIVERRFNPATFRYSLTEEIDVTTSKSTQVQGFVHLCKLHGSVSWIDEGEGIFPIKEKLNFDKLTKKKMERAMIYPTPAKHSSSMGSPYSDLFRQFHSCIVQKQSVLFVIGYSFGDEHINNIIYQALMIPTFRLVIFADPSSVGGEIGSLRDLKDPRIWIVGGDGPDIGQKAHYFNTVVNEFLPHRPNERIGLAINKIQDKISKSREGNT